MAATVGTALLPGSATLPGSGTIPGQGPKPIVRLLYSTDPPSDSTPTWTDATSLLRAYSTNRGRASGLEEIDAGKMGLTLDNNTRTFDPLNNAAIRPFNRWWLFEEFSGAVRDLFKGYALSYTNQWAEKGKDAIAVVDCSDELAVLAAAALPATDPIRESYAALIAVDFPEAYWDLNENPIDRVWFDTGSDVVHDFTQEPVDPPQERRGDRRAVPARKLRRPR